MQIFSLLTDKNSVKFSEFLKEFLVKSVKSGHNGDRKKNKLRKLNFLNSALFFSNSSPMPKSLEKQNSSSNQLVSFG